MVCGHGVGRGARRSYHSCGFVGRIEWPGGEAGNRGGYLRSRTLKADGRFPAMDADDHWWIPSGQSFFSTDPADSAATELAQARQHFLGEQRDVGDRIRVVEKAALPEHQQIAEAADAVAAVDAACASASCERA